MSTLLSQKKFGAAAAKRLLFWACPQLVFRHNCRRLRPGLLPLALGVLHTMDGVEACTPAAVLGVYEAAIACCVYACTGTLAAVVVKLCRSAALWGFMLSINGSADGGDIWVPCDGCGLGLI